MSDQKLIKCGTLQRLALLLILLTNVGLLHGQRILQLDASTHGTVHTVADVGTRITDLGGVDGSYWNGAENDFYMTIKGEGVCEAPYVFQFTIEQLDLRRKRNGEACPDTLFVYDGDSPSARLLWYATGTTYSPATMLIYASPTNTTQSLTVRFKVCGDCGTWDTASGGGFSIMAGCKRVCEIITPRLDSIYYKTRNGEVYEFGHIKHILDTVMWEEHIDATGETITHIDSNYFDAVNLCMGDGVIFTAHCDYTQHTGWYTPNDTTSHFEWIMGTDDTIRGEGKTSVYYNGFTRVDCYDVVLTVTDVNQCTPTIYPSVRVQVSNNPVRTIYTLDEICNRDSLLVTFGYGNDNSTLIMRHVRFEDMKSKTNDRLTFIPDGMNNCGGCYKAPVQFTDFPRGRTVTSAADICSICVNFEHSYMGDYDLAILCPTYGAAGMPVGHGKAILKSHSALSGAPSGTSGGGGRYTGLPYGGPNDGSWDDSGNICDSLSNPYGVGWNYCFSRNGDYMLVSGVPANTVPVPSGSGMSDAPMVQVAIQYAPVPAGFTRAGQTAGLNSVSTLDSSDHVGKVKYYTPAEDFSTLIGCPLNGEWNIEICDYLAADNGWIFSWSLDICNVSDNDCDFEVKIDSILWEPDTSSRYHDFDNGYYRGAVTHPLGYGVSSVHTPDTAGTFPFNIHVYDNFGCVWDTTTTITSYWTPQPSLGADTTLCGAAQLELDATDRHSSRENYSYIWEPLGQTTPTITTDIDLGEDKTYIVQVTNSRGTKHCTTRDTISIKQRRYPHPSFVVEPFTFEGCAPLRLEFRSQSNDADSHYWDFGDGVISHLANPVHTYTDGIYTLKYRVASVEGCRDSVVLDRTVAVYPTPKATFAWAPTYPSVLNPTVQFYNSTSPSTPDTKYFWEIQYNRDNIVSVHTIVDESPSYDFSTYATPNEVSGEYTVRLIARTDNLAPSGNLIYCRDTSESTVIVVNDFLQFPNVVTPNGDGINDRFVILNLVKGMGYPINTLDIYNKWGSRVYHKENITDEDDFWDPSNMPAGTYYYRFTARGYNGNIEHNGVVEVVK